MSILKSLFQIGLSMLRTALRVAAEIALTRIVELAIPQSDRVGRDIRSYRRASKPVASVGAIHPLAMVLCRHSRRSAGPPTPPTRRGGAGSPAFIKTML